MKIALLLILLIVVISLIAVPKFNQRAQDWFAERMQLTTGLTPAPAPASPASTNATDDLRTLMLDLINQDRAVNGLTPVQLGGNPAAQAHAEELFENGFLGHWGLDGMKPYMRYTLAGGQGSESENASGSNTPRVQGTRYVTTPADDSLRLAQEGLMASPGHRRNILNPFHETVNLGIACDDVNCAVVQQFASNYLQFEHAPEIVLGQLEFSGKTVKGFRYKSAQVWFDALPTPLEAAQIRTTYCYDSGTPIAFIRESAPLGAFYQEDSVEFTWTTCRRPGVTTSPPDQSGRLPWVDATVHRDQGDFFDVRVDISDYLAQYGRGVYTIIVWGDRDGSTVPLTNYSIFVENP